MAGPIRFPSRRRYFPWNFQVPKKYYDRIQHEKDPVKRVYYGMIEALDDAVGNVMKKLEQEGLADNCLIFLISDNNFGFSILINTLMVQLMIFI